MSSLRSALRRTARLTAATSLAVAPAALVLGTPQGASLVDSVGDSVKDAQVVAASNAASLAVGGSSAAGDVASASTPSSSRPAMAPRDTVLDREPSRISRAGSRAVAIAQVKANAPQKVAPQVVISPPAWFLPTSGYHLTSQFGDTSYLWSSGVHTGLDFAADVGTPIRAIADGVVRSAGYDGSYGNKTVITLPDGGTVWYCHQNAITVQPGQEVSAGQVIGEVGATGNVTGPHLHLEIREGGEPIDPYGYLSQHGVTP